MYIAIFEKVSCAIDQRDQVYSGPVKLCGHRTGPSACVPRLPRPSAIQASVVRLLLGSCRCESGTVVATHQPAVLKHPARQGMLRRAVSTYMQEWGQILPAGLQDVIFRTDPVKCVYAILTLVFILGTCALFDLEMWGKHRFVCFVQFITRIVNYR